MKVSVLGPGQAGCAVARILAGRGIEVYGPYGRAERDRALASGADVVVITTTSLLREVAPDIRAALEAGADVLTSAEEAADPWAVDAGLAEELDALARARRVSVLGAGLNPGFAFDALVLTLTGPCAVVRSIEVERVVDLSGFGATVLRRIGVGHTPAGFAQGVASGQVTGHIGFAQSIRVVARRLGVTIDDLHQEIEPLIARTPHAAPHLAVQAGQTAGFVQRYVAVAGGRSWFEARFTGHVAPGSAALVPRDSISLDADPPITVEVAGGLPAQAGSAALLANSVARVAAAPPGWVTVADVPPAVPRRVG